MRWMGVQASLREAEQRANLLGSVREEIRCVYLALPFRPPDLWLLTPLFLQRIQEFQQFLCDRRTVDGPKSDRPQSPNDGRRARVRAARSLPRLRESSDNAFLPHRQAYETRAQFQQQRSNLHGINARMNGVIGESWTRSPEQHRLTPPALSSGGAGAQLAGRDDQLAEEQGFSDYGERDWSLHGVYSVVPVWLTLCAAWTVPFFLDRSGDESSDRHLQPSSPSLFMSSSTSNETHIH